MDYKDEEVWPCWRKCVSVGWALRLQKSRPEPVSVSLPGDQDAALSYCFSAVLAAVVIMD